MAMQVVTNNRPRDIVEAWELSPKERAEFDYLDWEAIESGNDSRQFVRYRGQLHDLGDFLTTRGLHQSPELTSWDGYAPDSYFFGLVVRYVENFERVIVGLYLC